MVVIVVTRIDGNFWLCLWLMDSQDSLGPCFSISGLSHNSTTKKVSNKHGSKYASYRLGKKKLRGLSTSNSTSSSLGSPF